MHAPAEWLTLLRRQARPREGVHVTDCLACPRRKALLREGAEPDLARLEARLDGSMLHSALDEVDEETAEIAVHGHIFGVYLVGRADRIREPQPGELRQSVAAGKRVMDYKGEKAAGKSRKPDGVYREQAWQFEVYRRFAAGMGIVTVGWTAWFRYGAEWLDFSHDGPILSEEELAGLRPHGCAFTVAELAAMTSRAAPARELPLVGATMQLGKLTSCDYCEVEQPCRTCGNEVRMF